MVIYPPNSRAKFEKPNWAQNNTDSRSSQLEQLPSDFEYQPSAENSTSTTGEAAYTTQEVSTEMIEAARDKAQVKFIMANTESICAWRKLAQSQ